MIGPRGFFQSIWRASVQAAKNLHGEMPYTWVRIYLREGAPKELAYTIGIDASGVQAYVLRASVNYSDARREDFAGPDGSPRMHHASCLTLRRSQSRRLVQVCATACIPICGFVSSEMSGSIATLPGNPSERQHYWQPLPGHNLRL